MQSKSPTIGGLKYVGNYQMEKVLGEGTFGKVRLATHTLTSTKVAIKIIDKEKLQELSDRERLAREINIMKMVEHPNLIRLHEVIDTSRNMFLVMQYAPSGELFDYIVEREKLTEKEARKYFLQIASGVDYLHKKGIIHRDLKPENILFDAQSNVKIADFGFSTLLKQGQKLQTFCGSPAYAAPEMISGKDYLGPEVDIWSMGVILYAMVCGRLPFDNQNTSRLYQLILKCDYHLPTFLSLEVRQLLSRILVVQPSSRADMQEILSHGWIRSGDDLLQKSFSYEISAIDHELVQEMENIGFDSEYALKLLEECERNQVTATYWLLHEKKWKSMYSESSSRMDHLPDRKDQAIPHESSSEKQSFLPQISPTTRHATHRSDSVVESTLQSEKLPAITERKGSLMKLVSAVAEDSSNSPRTILSLHQRKGVENQIHDFHAEDESKSPATRRRRVSNRSRNSEMKDRDQVMSNSSVDSDQSSHSRNSSGQSISGQGSPSPVDDHNESKHELKEGKGGYLSWVIPTGLEKFMSEKLKGCLVSNNIQFKERSGFLECDDMNGVRFEIDLNVANTHNENPIIRMRRVSGENWTYRKLCQKIFNDCNA